MKPFEPNWASPPGHTILDILEERKLTITNFANDAGFSSDFTGALLCGKEPITPKVALVLSKVLGASEQFWLNRDQDYRKNCKRLGLTPGNQ